MIDINSAAKAVFLAMVGMLNEKSDRVYIYVKATPVFLKDNPHMANDVHMPEGTPIGHVILNVSASATRNLAIDEGVLYFDTRKQGVDYTLRVVLGDIIGTGIPDDGVIYDVTLIPICSPEGGTLVCRPMDSMDLADQATRAATGHQLEDKVAQAKPGLRVVK